MVCMTLCNLYANEVETEEKKISWDKKLTTTDTLQ